MLATYRPLSCLCRGGQRVFSKGPLQLLQRHGCFRLAIEAVEDDTMRECCRCCTIGRERPEEFGDQRRFAHPARAAERHDLAWVQVSQQPGAFTYTIGKVFGSPGK